MARSRLRLVHERKEGADSQATRGSAQARAGATTTRVVGQPAKMFRYTRTRTGMSSRTAQGAVEPTDELNGGIEYVRALADDIASSLSVAKYVHPMNAPLYGTTEIGSVRPNCPSGSLS